jgi:hypothetical protein
MNILELINELNMLLEEQRNNPVSNKNYTKLISEYMEKISKESIRYHNLYK